MSAINPYNYPNKTPCWYVFFTQWMISVPASFLINPTELKEFGVRVGNHVKKKDELYSHALNDLRQCMLSIAEVACLLEQYGGSEIAIVHTQDAVEMYRHLKDYLTAADKKWGNPLAINKPPPKDKLYILDRLAEALYPIASMYEKAEDLSTGFNSFLSSQGFFDHSGFKSTNTGWSLSANANNEVVRKIKYEYQSPLSSVVGRGPSKVIVP